MPSTMRLQRWAQRENEAGLSGSEAIEVENVGIPDQVISAGTEEQTALGGFKDHQLQVLSLLCDVDAVAQFLGVRYAILATTIGPPGTITHTGDLTQEIFAGDLVRLEGTAACDGVYRVDSDPVVGVTLAAGVTFITLALGQALPAAAGPVGTIARVCSQQVFPYAYTAVTVTAATGAITYTGDLTDKFVAGDFIVIEDSTGNDGYWEIDSITYAAPTTTIIVNLTPGGVAGLPDNTDDGNFAKCRAGIALTAAVPILWSIEGGLNNPFAQPGPYARAPLFNAFRGDVTYCMVTVPGAVNGNFAGRIGTNAIL